MKREPYDSGRACKKCSHIGADSAYRRTVREGYVEVPDLQRFVYEFGSKYRREVLVVDEWIERTCDRCGFEWQETPLDRSKDPESK